MMNSHFKQVSLRASTLVEMLVVMIVGGVIFLSVMDGMTLLQRYSKRIMERITLNRNLNNSYSLLESLVYDADSIAQFNSSILLYRYGEVKASLCLVDSTILLSSRDINDTLLQHVAVLKANSGLEPTTADTMSISLVKRDSTIIKINFTIATSSNKVHMVVQNEQNYNYE